MVADPVSIEALLLESERLREQLSTTVGELHGLCDALREAVRDLRGELLEPPSDGGRGHE